MKISTFSPIFSTLLLLTFSATAQARITNPALRTDGVPDAPEQAFAYYFAFYWGAFVTVGMIAVLLYLLWGALEWITSGGDKGKLESARTRMLNAVIGAILLVGAYTLVGAVGALIGIDLLSPRFFGAGN